jgi:hypothetical protein
MLQNFYKCIADILRRAKSAVLRSRLPVFLENCGKKQRRFFLIDGLNGYGLNLRGGQHLDAVSIARPDVGVGLMHEIVEGHNIDRGRFARCRYSSSGFQTLVSHAQAGYYLKIASIEVRVRLIGLPLYNYSASLHYR